MKLGAVKVRCGLSRSVPSLISPEEEAAAVRGSTAIFSFSLDELLGEYRGDDTEDGLILEALRDLAAHYPEHAAAKRIQGLYGKPERLVWSITGKTIDELEAKRLEAERAEWMRQNGVAS